MSKRFFMPPPASEPRRIRFRLAAIFSLFGLCCALAGATSPAAASLSEDARALVPDAPIERELQGGQTHVYKITLDAGAYLRLWITPRVGKVQSQLLAPGGSEDVGVTYYPTEAHNFREVRGSRFVSLVAEYAGSYRLEIRLAEGEKAGRYEVKIEDMRPATERDRIHVAAEKAESEGFPLVNNVKTAEQRLRGIAKYEEALTLWRRLGDDKAALRMLLYLTIQYGDIGELQTVLEYTRQTIELARTMGDQYQEANLMLRFGITYRNLGEYQKALDTFNQARQLFKDMSKRYGEANAVNGIGTTLALIGEWQNALPYLEEALPTFSSVGDRPAEIVTLNLMGRVHRALGDIQKGIEFHNRALALARQNNSLPYEASTLGFLGAAYFELGDKQMALDFSEQSLKLWRTIGNRAGEGVELKRIGEVMYLSGDNQRALDSLNQSLDLFRSTGRRRDEADTLHRLAEVNYSLGNLDEARKQIEQALEVQETSRANLISREMRDTIFTSAQSSFALYIDLLMQWHKKEPTAGHEAAALQASERARARGLLELLSESRADIREGVPQNLLELERSLQQRINAKAAARTRLLSDKRTEDGAASFNKEIAELTGRYREVGVQIRRSSPRYAALTQPLPLRAAEIQQQLDDDTVLLEFALGEKQSWLWAVTRSSINSYQLPSSNEIESSSRQVYELLTARQPKKGETGSQYQARISEADVKLQAEAATLSQMLLGQIAVKLRQEWRGKRLAIVAPGALEYLPFAALPGPQGSGVGGLASGKEKASDSYADMQISKETGNANPPRPLLVDHEIVNLPSASALAAIRSETAGRNRAEKTVAVLADPVFEPSDPRVPGAVRKTSGGNLNASARSGGEAQTSPQSQASPATNSELLRALRSFNLTNERGGFSRLPFSREEAEAIASLAPKNSSMKATDFQANRTTATGGELSHYRVIHFATHGLLNGEQPELSGLVLSLVEENGKPQDGFLRMHEIYNLQLPADLIVLSACQTALGKQIKGEGLVGLTRGFMYAGARRVVASLWQVDDLATAQLMKSFYRGMLKEGLRPAAALRAAQLETSKQKRWSSPFFWAAFTIQGEWK